MISKIFTILTILVLLNLSNASFRPKAVNISEVNDVYDKPWFSGYLDFTFQGYSTHMHYFYFPSQSDKPENDPLLFWFNGGPGCSSLLGALYEHGPFIFNDAFGFLMNNPEAWNKRANTVYIQSPAQVGFSYFYLDPQEQYPGWDDQKTAQLNLQSVLQFLNTYPQFKGRDTYLAGQSYGGIYIPTLAHKIHKYNLNNTGAINLKGFAVGNGCTDSSQCQFLSDYPHYLYQLLNDIGILSDQSFMEAQRLCANSSTLSDECVAAMDDIDQLIDGINIYDAFRPCWQNSVGKAAHKYSFSDLRKMALRTGYKTDQNLKTFAPPCVDSEGIDKLLNNYDNRRQLGIPENVPQYSMCVPQDDFNYTRSSTGSYYVYQDLIPLNKYKIVIYSGDSDPAVPISGTLKWMNKIKHELSLATEQYWRPWMTKTKNGEQNSGSFWKLSHNLSLVRFKGVGHMAPQWNNQGGTKMINYLLFDEPL